MQVTINSQNMTSQDAPMQEYLAALGSLYFFTGAVYTICFQKYTNMPVSPTGESTCFPMI